jgi:hypothetical protein
MHALEAPHLAHGLGQRLLGHAHVLHLAPVLVGLLHARVGLAELRLDGAQLLAQVGLALAAGHLVAHLRLDLGLHRRHVELAPQQRVDLAQARQRILDLEQLLGLRRTELQIRRHEVGEPPRVVDVGGHGDDLGREVLQREQLFETQPHRAHQRLRLDAPVAAVVRRVQPARAHPQRALLLDEGVDPRLGQSLHQHLHAAVGQSQDAHHHHDRSHAVQVVGLGILDLGIALREQQHQPVAGHRVLDGGDRPLPNHEERKNHVGKHHHVPQRQDRQLLGNRVGRKGLGHRPVFRRRRHAT